MWASLCTCNQESFHQIVHCFNMPKLLEVRFPQFGPYQLFSRAERNCMLIITLLDVVVVENTHTQSNQKSLDRAGYCDSHL